MQQTVTQLLDRDPIELLGITFVALGIFLFLIFGFRLLQSYQKSEKRQTLYLALEFVFGGLGMFFLLIEQVILILNVDTTTTEYLSSIPPMQSIFQFADINVYWVAWIAAALAWITSSAAIVSAVFFVFSFFPDSNRNFIIPPLLLMIIYLGLILISPFQWSFEQGDWSPEHLPMTNVILWVLFFVPLWSVVLLFFYLTISLYRRGSPSWRRLLWIFVTQTLLSLAFTIEIINPSMITQYLSFLSGYEGTISTVSRFFLMIYPVLMWIGVLTPNWAKKRLGVST
ncbi:MAG: hypothetical protein ACXAC8_08220 [Candidatus Hodarchaeales archaeon]